ncbi:hypothetical protein D3C80_1642740 [compost metagenome]
MVVDLRRGVEHEDGRERGQQHAQPGPGQHQAYRVAVASPGLAKQEHGNTGAACAQERQRDVLADLGQAKQRDAEDYRQRGAGIDTQQARLGQRVACQRLHQGARRPQRQAGQQCHQGARHA